MADRPHSGLPTPNWRWPEVSVKVTAAGGTGTGTMTGVAPGAGMFDPGDGRCRGHIFGIRCGGPPSHEGPCALAYGDVDQLRKDRDELAAALEWMLRAYADSDDCESIRDTLSRVKGR